MVNDDHFLLNTMMENHVDFKSPLIAINSIECQTLDMDEAVFG